MPKKNNFSDLPSRFQKIWQKAGPLLKAGRPGDFQHAQETVRFILDYKGRLKIDQNILVPVAIMHDVGHYAILPEHFKYITGPEKITNGKLVHMLAGAKIARDILKTVKYPSRLSQEIVEMISVHDAEQLQGANLKKIYNTDNKRIFHDIDCLDRYTEARIEAFRKMYSRAEFLRLLTEMSDGFFYPEFKKLTRERLKSLVNL